MQLLDCSANDWPEKVQGEKIEETMFVNPRVAIQN